MIPVCEAADMSGHTYIRGLAASAVPRRVASLELGSILAAWRNLCAVECSQIVASAAVPRRVAVRRIVNQAKGALLHHPELLRILICSFMFQHLLLFSASLYIFSSSHLYI